MDVNLLMTKTEEVHAILGTYFSYLGFLFLSAGYC